MSDNRVFLLLVASLLLYCPVVHSKVLIFDNGVNSSQCLKGVCPCRSLKYVANASNINNTVIRINSTNCTLDGVVQFTGVDNVTITGQDQNTTIITCNTTNGGLHIVNSSNIRLQNFLLKHCGLLMTHLTQIHDNSTAILVNNSCHITISRITVSNSNGRGLTFINSCSMQLSQSHFMHNKINPQYKRGGGGLLIVFIAVNGSQICGDYHMNISNNSFMNNSFMNNTARASLHYTLHYGGAGIQIVLINTSVDIVATGNAFSNNHACNNSGGGLGLLLSGTSVNNSINFINSTFTDNVARSGGGAAVSYDTHRIHSNNVTFSLACFERNKASYSGGGVAIAAALNNNKSRNRFICKNCHFKSNTAKEGSAVDVRPAFVKHYGTKFNLSVSFNNSVFVRNGPIKRKIISSYRNGVFVTTGITIYFYGQTSFNNSGSTALYIVSAKVQFNNDSVTMFSGNSGYHGGAIYCIGDSRVVNNINTTLKFIGNTASFGGAISVLSEEIRVLPSSNYCFLNNKNRNAKNISFHFSGNRATLVGNDIYATTIKPCVEYCKKYCKNKSVNHTNIFTDKSCFGRFYFGTDRFDVREHVATAPLNICLGRKLNKVIPGRPTWLNITVYDELQGNVTGVFPLSVRAVNSTTSPKLSGAMMITLNGTQGTHGQLILETLNKQLTTNFTLGMCPPGFINSLEKNSKCDCHKFEVFGLICSSSMAKLRIGLWVGYANTSRPREDQLLTGVCSTQLCTAQNLLPLNVSPHELNDIVCKHHREGRLCGRCKKGHSVLMHSLSCKHNNTCQYGILFYILKELLPVTVLFLVILVFNISLTSGALNSFVFYTQVISAFDITAFGTIEIKDAFLKRVVKHYKLDFNLFGDLCVMQTDSVMTVLIMRYAITIYAFILVLGTILVLRVYSCYSCVKLCRRCGRRNIRGSIVDGLSAIIVLFYSRCAFTTEKILLSANVHGINNYSTIVTVCLYDGELNYLQGDHLWYAVPAFLCIIFILIPPPLILLLEPLLTKLLSLEWFSETLLKWYYNKLRLKLMPFLDSFQSCFKDKHRYFAGLYFIYRVILPIFFRNTRLYESYGGAMLFLFVVVFIHTIVQPNKKGWHNVLEQSIFINLIVVFGLTVLNHYAATPSCDVSIAAASSFDVSGDKILLAQLVLIAIPILYLIAYIVISIYKKVSSHYNLRCCKKLNNWCREWSQTEEDTSLDIPARLDSNISFDYSTFDSN